MLHKIFYNKKVTTANTTYLQIADEDTQFLITKCIQIQAYMGELSLVKNKEIRDVYKWYTTPTKTLPYSNLAKRYNSPQSFISGTLNNMMFGSQTDCSEVQAEHLQNIINSYQQLTDCINTEFNIKLQKEGNTDSVMFVENVIW
jgi:hypothetical protein